MGEVAEHCGAAGQVKGPGYPRMTSPSSLRGLWYGSGWAREQPSFHSSTAWRTSQPLGLFIWSPSPFPFASLSPCACTCVCVRAHAAAFGACVTWVRNKSVCGCVYTWVLCAAQACPEAASYLPFDCRGLRPAQFSSPLLPAVDGKAQARPLSSVQPFSPSSWPSPGSGFPGTAQVDVGRRLTGSLIGAQVSFLGPCPFPEVKR